MHGDDEPYGSVQRVELFDRFPRTALLTDVVGIMNRAATEDVARPSGRSSAGCCGRGRRRPRATSRSSNILDDWVGRDAPRLDANDDGLYDEAGPVIMDAALAADRQRRDDARCSAISSTT